MPTIPFCKFHGFGNDYIVIEKQLIGEASLPDLAKAICHRHTGAGADGIAVVGKLGNADAAGRQHHALGLSFGITRQPGVRRPGQARGETAEET